MVEAKVFHSSGLGLKQFMTSYFHGRSSTGCPTKKYTDFVDPSDKNIV